jgi:hypothetical protein
MRRRSPSVVVSAPPRADGQLSVVEVDWTQKLIVFSDGEVTFTPWEKLITLASQLCEAQVAVHKRTWTTSGGEELILLTRAGARVTFQSPLRLRHRMTPRFEMRTLMGNYDTWKTTDTLGDDLDGDSRQEQYLDDEARDLRWQAFRDWAREQDMAMLLFLCSRYVHLSADRLRVVLDHDFQALADFVELEQWSGVFRAVAEIQQEREHAA